MKSNPKYFRTNSKSRYVCDNSKFGCSRSRSSQFKHGNSQSKERSKSTDRPKSDLFKKVEQIEKKLEKVDKVEKSVNEMMEMLRRNLINMKYVEEEIVIDVKFVDSNIGNNMIINSEAPLSIVSSNWLDRYVNEAKVDNNDLVYKNCARRFRLGKTLYVSNVEVRFPIVLKTEKNDYIKREIEAQHNQFR